MASTVCSREDRQHQRPPAAINTTAPPPPDRSPAPTRWRAGRSPPGAPAAARATSRPPCRAHRRAAAPAPPRASPAPPALTSRPREPRILAFQEIAAGVNTDGGLKVAFDSLTGIYGCRDPGLKRDFQSPAW